MAATHSWQEMWFRLDDWVEFNELIIEPPVRNMGRGYGKRRLTNILVGWEKGSCKIGVRQMRISEDVALLVLWPKG